MLQFPHMSASDTQNNAVSSALKTFQKEKQQIVKERTKNIKKIIAEIDEQKTDTIKQQIAKLP